MPLTVGPGSIATAIALVASAQAWPACRNWLCWCGDFASFASDISDEPEISTIRQVYQAKVERDGDIVVFNIVANAFIRHQIRSTAGALVQVGLNKLSEVEFVSILEDEKNRPGRPNPPGLWPVFDEGKLPLFV